MGSNYPHSTYDSYTGGIFVECGVKHQVLQNKDDLAPYLNHSDFFPMPLVLGKSNNLEERKKETTTIMLKLRKQQIQTLKGKENQDIEDSSIFSRFEGVSVHIWKCVSMARGLKPEQETMLFVTVDFCNRMKLSLPKRYFGNAVMALPVRSTVGEILLNSLSHYARRIREAIDDVTDEYVRSYLNCIKNIPDI